MKFLEKQKKKFLENYTARLLVAAYDVANVKDSLGIDEQEFNKRVLAWLRGEESK